MNRVLASLGAVVDLVNIGSWSVVWGFIVKSLRTVMNE